MEWTREKTLLLISEYRQRRGLWDMTCDEYRKKDVKQRLLNEVSEVLGGNIPIQELEKKFHTLRTQYHREISRMKRKEPYNSKWFGFKNLVFLSSPYACRSTKGRLKTELQAEGGAAQKYILGEAADNSGNMNDEYISPTTPRKSHASNRAKELEKLIEETTKDVDDIDEPDVEEVVEAKPKLAKQLNGPYVQMQEDDGDPIDAQQQQHQHAQSMLDLHQSASAMEAVSFQANESGELHYQSTSTATSTPGNGGGGGGHAFPTRIIKIQRRDTASQEDGYFDDLQAPPKRIYYEPSGATILSTATLTATAQNGNAMLTTNVASATPTTGTLRLPRVSTAALSPPKPASSPAPAPSPSHLPPTVIAAAPLRDEFSTYGEYVANEMRAIGSREVLIELKHKINTAIFEANMAELQK